MVDILRWYGSSLGLPSEARPQGERRMVAQIFTSWNRLADWLGLVDALQNAA
jgi:hypothetical protein